MEQHGKSSLAALTLGAIGVVYGDIGTSVLYAMKEVFGSGHVEFTPDNVYGVLSIFFWTLTIIVSIKYVALVLRADNHGEGGLVAMLALASMAVKDKPVLRHRMLIVGIFGVVSGGRFGGGVARFHQICDSDHAHHFVRLVRDAKTWHGRHRQIFWTHHFGVVLCHRGLGALSHCVASRNLVGHQPLLRDSLHHH